MSTAIKTKFLVSHLLVNSIEQHLRILVNSTQLSYSWEPCPAEPIETQVQPDLTVLVLFKLLFTSNFVGPFQNFILRLAIGNLVALKI